MPYKDKEAQRQAVRDAVQRHRQKDVIPDPVIPENVIPSVIPKTILADELIPTDPYNEVAAREHMMRMHPVYSDKVITTSGGVRCRPVIGWREGEVWKPTPIIVKVDKAKLARLRKVIKDLELVKVR